MTRWFERSLFVPPSRRPDKATPPLVSMALARSLLLGAGALVAGLSVHADQKSAINLIAPQVMNETVACGSDCDNRQCENGCTPQKYCLRQPCYEGEKCEVEPVRCKDEWCFQDAAQNEPCPAERRSEFCGDSHGKVCEDRLGHETKSRDTPMQYKAKHVKAGECVSIMVGTTDRWCQFTCTSGQDCPKANCVCGDLSGIDMTHDLASEAQKNADDLKALMDAACDFDAQGCNHDVIPQCRACYLHFESCKNWCARATTQPQLSCSHCLLIPHLCHTRPHFEDDGATPKQMTLDDCMKEVAESVAECGTCSTPESIEAYKVRTGEHDPPGVSQPGRKNIAR